MNKETISEQIAKEYWKTVKEMKASAIPINVEVQINCPYEVVKGADFDIDKPIEI